ncbi:hypothetical protein EVAR_76647_1 [Eumeta japonica]|uniref:Uncharacterized protein n=1 Tax=Eumeta variegata TaxID=151549 RepID=A0A4C1T8E2_EUMVA|nr:hypothetical protein EVAR_76647_1 [Eumeta japonica]
MQDKDNWPKISEANLVKLLVEKSYERRINNFCNGDFSTDVFLSRHLGVGGHVKFIVWTDTSEEGFRETRGAHRIDDL